MQTSSTAFLPAVLAALHLATAGSPALAQAPDDLHGRTPAECLTLPGCVCYLKPALDRLAGYLVDGQKCNVELAEKDKFIRDSMNNFAPAPAVAWWQEPHVIVGGIAVTAALSTLFTFWVVRK